MSKFKKTNTQEVDKNLEKQLEGRESEGTTSNLRPKLKDGLNVFTMLPMVETMIEPYIFRYIHYNPFHMCGRDALIPDSKAKEGLKEDKNFRNCPRCITAWNNWEKAGKPSDGNVKKSFTANMSARKCLVQVVEVTPFFDWDHSNDQAKFNKDVYNQHFDQFVKVLRGEDNGDGLPEDILECAKTGIGPLIVNDKVGLLIRGAHRDLILDLEGDDPLFEQDKYLLTIIQRDGKAVGDEDSIRKKSHAVKFTKPGLVKGWKVTEDYSEYFVEAAQDLNNLKIKGDGVQAKVEALHRLTEEELDEYLAMQGHSYITSGDATEDEDIPKTKLGTAGSSPDSFAPAEDSVMDSSGKADISKLRQKFKDA